IIYMNRQRGAGTRVLLDYWLKKENISHEDIKGYEREEYTHIKTAAAVNNGSADTAMGIKAAANALDLDFIPLVEECYDLIFPEKMLKDERIEVLISIIKSNIFRKRVAEMGGYSTTNSGEVKKIE
ncbi:MAG TPA: substrate-binding domain-containing protein, partial [Halanaerobiales bacterium]|nr:substrate-binding domain-containing protein [Halanaerobiales bacterium]